MRINPLVHTHLLNVLLLVSLFTRHVLFIQNAIAFVFKNLIIQGFLVVQVLKHLWVQLFLSFLLFFIVRHLDLNVAAILSIVLLVFLAQHWTWSIVNFHLCPGVCRVTLLQCCKSCFCKTLIGSRFLKLKALWCESLFVFFDFDILSVHWFWILLAWLGWRRRSLL